jgi:hypothetical protein
MPWSCASRVFDLGKETAVSESWSTGGNHLKEVFVRRFLLVLIASAALTAMAPSLAAGAQNPSGTGPPSQSCQEINEGKSTPGHSASSPGSPFNEPSSTSNGGTGGQHYTEKSQYDVACYQQSQK